MHELVFVAQGPRLEDCLLYLWLSPKEREAHTLFCSSFAALSFAMLGHLEKAKRAHGNLRGTQHDMPPSFDPDDMQFGTQVGDMSKHDADAVRAYVGTAAELRERNAEAYAIGTPDVWAVATPDTMKSSPEQQPSKVLGTAQALMPKMLPYGSRAKVTGD